MLRALLLLVCVPFLILAASAQNLQQRFDEAARDKAAIPALIRQGSGELAALLEKDPRRAVLLADTLEPWCRRVYFSPESIPGAEQLGITTHVVQKGELPSKIAAAHRIGAGMLGYLNSGFDERKLRVGQKLKVIDLLDRSLRIEVRRDLFRMFVWRKAPDGGGELLMATMPVGLGAEKSPTPAGATKIEKRVLNPVWTHPETKKVIPAGDPENILGGYWIALSSDGIGKSGIGFHGYTGEPAANWIQKPASHGCVRMLQPDIDRVFHLALEGTSVALTH
ncbi:MAG: L,D-transpeptidase family protein [Planctomycetia bacterium]